ALAVGTRGEAGGKIDAAFGEEERPAHAPQLGRLVKPDETVPIVSLLVPHPGFVNERQPSAIEGDQLGAAPELVGLDRRRGLGDRWRLIVDEPGWIAEIDELQRVAANARHPVLLVLPRSFRAKHAPIGEPAEPPAFVDASQHLLAPPLAGQFAHAADAP